MEEASKYRSDFFSTIYLPTRGRHGNGDWSTSWGRGACSGPTCQLWLSIGTAQRIYQSENQEQRSWLLADETKSATLEPVHNIPHNPFSCEMDNITQGMSFYVDSVLEKPYYILFLCLSQKEFVGWADAWLDKFWDALCSFESCLR